MKKTTPFRQVSLFQPTPKENSQVSLLATETLEQNDETQKEINNSQLGM